MEISVRRFKALVRDIPYLNLSRRNVGYIGWAGHNNLGDEALIWAFRHVLFSRFTILEYKAWPVVRVFNKYVQRSYSAVLLGGGTLIGAGYLEDVQDAMDRGLQVHVFGTGVRHPEFYGPEGEQALAAWVPVLRRCTSIAVRGPLSVELLADNGLRATMIGDPALALSAPCEEPPPGRPVLGLNVGHSRGRIWGRDESAVCDRLAEMGRRLLAKGWEVQVFPVWNEDEPICRELVGKLAHPHAVLTPTDYVDPRPYLREMERVTVFVGMKLHSVVLAHCRATPAVMLEYRPKCRDYMLSVGEGENVVRTDQILPDDLVRRVETLAAERRARSAAIRDRVAEICRRLKARAELIARCTRTPRNAHPLPEVL